MYQFDPKSCHPIRSVSSRIPGKPSIATLNRWIRKGIKNCAGKLVVLESFKIGRARFVTEDAIAEFVRELNKGTSPTESTIAGNGRAKEAGNALDLMGA
jgi:hypothetical protein